MKSATFTVLLLLVFHASAFAQDSPTVASPTPLPELTLAGKVGFGIDNFDLIGTSPSFRYWLSDRTALEVLGGGYDNLHTWGMAFGLKENMARPSRYLYLQMLERYSFILENNSPSLSAQWHILTVGAGFEAFMPFCTGLSVEGWLGADLRHFVGPKGSTTDFETVASDLTLFNLGVHFDF